MKKISREIVCLIMALCIATCCMPQQTKAETQKYSYPITTLAQKKTVNAKGYYTDYYGSSDTWIDTYNLYKITVPSGGYVSFMVNSKNNEINIFKTYKKNAPLFSSEPVAYLYGKTSYYNVMPAGTYYLYADKGTKFSWQFVKPKAQTNYCRSRAVVLSAEQKKLNVFLRGREFSRWYKISLPSKKYVTITLNNLAAEYGMDADLFTASGVRIETRETDGASGKFVYFKSSKALPKGTYYIRANCTDYYSSDEIYTGRMGTVMWK